jgi:hypothetical protein
MTAKYRLIMEDEDDFQTSLIFRSDDLGDVIANMEIFLKGCGFIFDGALDIHTGDVEKNAMHYVYRGTTDREFDDVIKHSDELDMEFKDD